MRDINTRLSFILNIIKDTCTLWNCVTTISVKDCYANKKKLIGRLKNQSLISHIFLNYVEHVKYSRQEGCLCHIFCLLLEMLSIWGNRVSIPGCSQFFGKLCLQLQKYFKMHTYKWILFWSLMAWLRAQCFEYCWYTIPIHFSKTYWGGFEPSVK